MSATASRPSRSASRAGRSGSSSTSAARPRHDLRRVRDDPPQRPVADTLRPRRAAAAPLEGAGARLPRPRGAVAARPVRADLRPVGVDHLGPPDHGARPQHHQRPVVEAAADPLHDAVRAVRRRRRAQPVAADLARRRAAGDRDGLPARLAARRPRRGRHRRRLAAARRRVRAQLRPRQLRGPARRGLPVGDRAPPRRPPHRRLPARLRRGAAAPRGVAVLRALRAVARVDRAAPARARARRLRAQRLPVVRARVLGLGRLAARGQPRPPAQPGLGRLRRPPVHRGLPPLRADPVRAGAAGRGHRGRGRVPRAAPRPARAGRRRRRADGHGGADDRGRLRGQPALRRAAGRAPVRARGRRLGRARARGARALRAHPGDRARPPCSSRPPRRSCSRTSARCATARAGCARRRSSTARCRARSRRRAAPTPSSAAATSSPATSRSRWSRGS